MNNEIDLRLAAFTEAMIELYRRILRETGHRSSALHEMVSEQGGHQAVVNLIHAQRPSAYYFTLHQIGRLDLAVEAFVLRPEWLDIFTD